MLEVDALYQYLLNIKYSVAHIIPELVLSVGILAMVVLDLFVPVFERIKTGFVCVLLFAIAFLCVSDMTPELLFNDTYRITPLSQFLKVTAVLGTGCFILFLRGRYSLIVNLESKAEYDVLVLTVLLSSFLIFSSQNLLLSILGLETISLCSYLLVVFNDLKKSTEAGVKYLLFGAVSGGLLIYGVSLIFLETHSLSYQVVFNYPWEVTSFWGVFGIICFSLGLLFKLGVVPMHLWMPDVYNGASFPLISFLAIIPKLVAIQMIYLFLSSVEWGLFLGDEITLYFAVIAMLSITLGNVMALWQKSAKRLMAYSGIAHGGMLLIGVIAGSAMGWMATLFYFLTYLFMTFASLVVLSFCEKISNSDRLDALSGVGKKYPLLGIVAVISFVSLIGLPPTVGFTSKLLVFSSLWSQISQADSVLMWLFVVGLINTVIGLFYYIKIPYFMFFKSSEQKDYPKLNFIQELFLIAICLPLILLFIWPNWLLSIIENLI